METLGTSLGATAFATLFSALVPDGATGARTFVALGLIFGIGAAVMGGATVVAATLLAAAARPLAGRPQRTRQRGDSALVAGDFDPLHAVWCRPRLRSLHRRGTARAAARGASRSSSPPSPGRSGTAIAPPLKLNGSPATTSSVFQGQCVSHA